MGTEAIRAGLEVKLDNVDPKLPTAWENSNFKTGDGSAWQDVWLMLARPENPTMGDGFYRQRGYLQVNLKYPLNTGPADAQKRANLLRDTFYRGLSLTTGTITTTVEETPEIGRGSNEGDRYVVPVFIRFYANVQP